MAWLNYHHLLYFWTVARTGSIAAASQELHVSQPTISAQIKELEGSLGHELFRREGRGLVLTDTGRLAFRYADEIFRLGKEFQLALEGRSTEERVRFSVGVVQVIPKMVAERLLEPAFGALPNLLLDVREAPLPQLLASLALHELDVVISDAPAPSEMRVKAYSHLLGETGTTFFAPPGLAGLKKDFPRSLDGAPALLPARGSQLRRQVEDWFDAHGIQPRIAAELEDTALAKVLAQRGLGVVVAPEAIEAHVVKQYSLKVIGRAPEIKERFYAISVERKLKHPAVTAIAESARTELFA
ncbi:MAG: LysR family transcriptional regulator [Myxococcaceae bacterium]